MATISTGSIELTRNWVKSIIEDNTSSPAMLQRIFYTYGNELYPDHMQVFKGIVNNRNVSKDTLEGMIKVVHEMRESEAVKKSPDRAKRIELSAIESSARNRLHQNMESVKADGNSRLLRRAVYIGD